MRNIKELTCIGCPIGCFLQVELEGNTVKSVKGNTCKKGEVYGIEECTSPTRIVTTLVRVGDGVEEVCSVKTEKGVPKNMIFESLKLLNKVSVKAPVKINDIIVKNILGTGVNIIATKNVDLK